MSSLEQEVRTLQKQVRRQRRWNIALGALVGVGGLMAATSAQQVPDVIRAKKVEVVNDEGKVLVSMRGEQSVSIEGDSVGLPVDNGVVQTRNSMGINLTALNRSPWGAGQLRIGDGNGKPLVILGDDFENGRITVFGGAGRRLVKIGGDEGGGYVVTENGKEGDESRVLVLIGTTPMGGRVVAFNSMGKAVLMGGAHPEGGSGVLFTLDSQGEGFTSTTPSP